MSITSRTKLEKNANRMREAAVQLTQRVASMKRQVYLYVVRDVTNNDFLSVSAPMFFGLGPETPGQFFWQDGKEWERIHTFPVGSKANPLDIPIVCAVRLS